MKARKIKYLFFTLICMFVVPLMANAECDYQRQAELSRLASNVQLAYTYNGTDFTIYMTNLTSDLYAVNDYGRVIQGGAEKTFNAYSTTVSYNIYSNDKNCYGEQLLTKTISLPSINFYSFYDECKQYPNFKYCQKWGELAISEQEFKEAIADYKDTLKARNKDNIKEKSSFWDIVIDVLENNMIMFIIFGSVILIFLIYVFIKRRQR